MFAWIVFFVDFRAFDFFSKRKFSRNMTKFLFTKFDLRKIFLKQLSMKLNARKRSGKISEE